MLSSNKFGKNISNEMLSNKKAQLGETLTWIVATIIIIFILVAFVFAANLMGKAKSIEKNKISLEKGDVVTKTDWIEVKTFLSYEKNVENKVKIDSWIKEAKTNDN